MADAFIHIPALRDRLIAPETSKARVTEAVLAQWDARVKALGGDADWRLADEVREASRQTVLQSFDQAADLWVFAYGSLMWDPAIHFAEVRRASLSGFKRCFNYQVLAGRHAAGTWFGAVFGSRQWCRLPGACFSYCEGRG